MRYNFLITTVGGITSPEIINAVRKYNKNVLIIGIDQNKNAIGKFFVDKFIQAPKLNSNTLEFNKFINKIIIKYKINCIIPCGNNDNLFLNKNKKKIKSRILNALEFSDKNFFDKITTYDHLKKNDIKSCPEFFLIKNINEFDFAKKKLNSKFNNLILKPSLGTGGRGVFEIFNQINCKELFSQRTENNLLSYNDLSNILKKNKKKMILMKKYNSKIYSVYTLCLKGTWIYSITHIREWGNASQTYRGQVFVNKKLNSISAEIVKSLKLSYLVNMEFAKDDNNDFKLIDLNPRIGASAAIHSSVGINLLPLTLDLLFKKQVTIPKKYLSFKKTFYRFFDKLWV